MVEEQVHSVEEGLLLLEKGSRLRSVGSTAMNQHSSRSHALIYLNVKVWFCVCLGNLGNIVKSVRILTNICFEYWHH